MQPSSPPQGSPTNTDKGFKTGCKVRSGWRAGKGRDRLPRGGGTFLGSSRSVCVAWEMLGTTMPSGMYGVFLWCVIPTLASPAPVGGYPPAPKLIVGQSQCEVGVGCWRSVGSRQSPWPSPISEWSRTFHCATGRFPAAGGKWKGPSSAEMRCLRRPPGPTWGPKTSRSPMSKIPSHGATSSLVRRGCDGTREGDGKPHLLSSCYVAALAGVYISPFNPQ